MILIPKPFRLTRSTGCSHPYAATPNLPRVSPVVTTTQACRKDTKQRLGLLEGRAEGRVLHGICPFHFVACFFGRHLVGKTCIKMGVPCHVLPKPLNHGSGNAHVERLTVRPASRSMSNPLPCNWPRTSAVAREFIKTAFPEPLSDHAFRAARRPLATEPFQGGRRSHNSEIS